MFLDLEFFVLEATALGDWDGIVVGWQVSFEVGMRLQRFGMLSHDIQPPMVRQYLTGTMIHMWLKHQRPVHGEFLRVSGSTWFGLSHILLLVDIGNRGVIEFMTMNIVIPFPPFLRLATENDIPCGKLWQTNNLIYLWEITTFKRDIKQTWAIFNSYSYSLSEGKHVDHAAQVP